jgi:hypothetical protein
VQFEKLLDETNTEDTFETPASTANAPPLQKDGEPVAPPATVTRLLLNVESETLKLARETLLA